MANGKIIQLKELDDLSTPIYPVTKADAVYLQNGSLLTDYLRGFPQTTIGSVNQPIYLNNGVLTAGNEVYSKSDFGDRVIATGTSGVWITRTWASGRKESFGTITGSCECTHLEEKLYYGPFSFSLPSGFFSSAPRIFTQVSITGGYGAYFVANGSITASSCSGWIFTDMSKSFSTLYLYVHAFL